MQLSPVPVKGNKYKQSMKMLNAHQQKIIYCIQCTVGRITLDSANSRNENIGSN